MNHVIERALQFFPDFNRRIHLDGDQDDFCKKNRVGRIETELIEDLGEFCVHREVPLILINKFVNRQFRPWVTWHEIGHVIFHSPLSCKFSTATRKIEIEANVVAALLLIPQHLLRTKQLWEIQEEFNYPRRLIEFRKDLYDNYKNEENKWLK